MIWIRRASLGLVMACSIGGASAAVAPAGGDTLVAAFAGLCLSGDTAPAAVLARADRAGWTPSATADFQRGTRLPEGAVVLGAARHLTRGETMDSCGVKAMYETPDVVAAAKRTLGFDPYVDSQNAASFYIERVGTTLRSGANIDRAAFAKAKAEGRWMTLTVATSDGSSFLVLLHPQPPGR